MSTNQGWIKIHRQILDWEWYDEPNTFRLFIHLLLKANHKPKKYRGVLIGCGQIMTGQELLAKELNLTRSKIRIAMHNLKTTNEIAIKSSRQGTIIQIVNYKNYQVITNKTTKEQPEDNQAITTNKNDYNEDNDEVGEVFSNDVKLTPEQFKKWFNKNRTKYLEKESNCNYLSKEDKIHLETLTKTYEGKHFNKAIYNMCQDKWANENNQCIPRHFLKPDNFTKYLNIEPTPLLTKRQKIHRGWINI